MQRIFGRPCFVLFFALFLATFGATFGATLTGEPARALAKSVRAPKPPTLPAAACGLDLFPLSKDATWTYRSGADSLVVTVVGVTDTKGTTTLEVSERLGDREPLTTSWSCTRGGGLTLPTTSFFFAGEPGGLTAGMQLAQTAHDEVWLKPLAALVVDFQWTEKVRFDIARTDTSGKGATHPDAKLELERTVTVQAPEAATTDAGTFPAMKVTYGFRGRARVGESIAELLVKRDDPALWFSPGIGVVRIEDAFERTWDLVASSRLPLPTVPAAPAP